MTTLDQTHFVPVGGGRLWSVASGAGPALLLFNGGPGCSDYLAPVAELLRDVCRVVRFEPRGCGRSVWDGNYDLETLVSDAEAIREFHGIDRWIVGGHSHGPNVALAYALRHPTRTLGVIGIAGGKIVDDRHWSESYHSRRELVGEDAGGVEMVADPEVNRRGNASWREYCRNPRLLRELAELQLPCVFINAGDDIRPNWPTQQLAALIPRALYVEIAAAAHYVWLTHAAALGYELRRAVDYVLRVHGRGAAAP